MEPLSDITQNQINIKRNIRKRNHVLTNVYDDEPNSPCRKVRRNNHRVSLQEARNARPNICRQKTNKNNDITSKTQEKPSEKDDWRLVTPPSSNTTLSFFDSPIATKVEQKVRHIKGTIVERDLSNQFITPEKKVVENPFNYKIVEARDIVLVSKDLVNHIATFLHPSQIPVLMSVQSAWYTIFNGSNLLQSAYEYKEGYSRYTRLVKKERSYNFMGYLKRQPDLSRDMREILFDWMLEVHTNYDDTFAAWVTSLQMVDLVLNKLTLPRSKLQLVGITSILLATKNEQVNCEYDLRSCQSISANTYTKREIAAMEIRILQLFHYNLCFPNLYYLLSDLIVPYTDVLSEATLTYGRYVIFRGLYDYYFASRIRKSVVIATIACIMLTIEGKDFYDLAIKSRTSIKQLISCAHRLQSLIKIAPNDKMRHLRLIFDKQIKIGHWPITRFITKAKEYLHN